MYFAGKFKEPAWWVRFLFPLISNTQNKTSIPNLLDAFKTSDNVAQITSNAAENMYEAGMDGETAA